VKPACDKEFQITLLSANLFTRNTELAGILDEIKSVDPDIIVLQEYTPKCHNFFMASDVFKRWSYSLCVPRYDTFGSAILSKMRITQADSFHLDEMSVVQTMASIDIDGQVVTVFNVHLVPPGIKHYLVHLQQQMSGATIIPHLN